eukprot:1398997-Alexandrium_andersonii.AAC.1
MSEAEDECESEDEEYDHFKQKVKDEHEKTVKSLANYCSGIQDWLNSGRLQQDFEVKHKEVIEQA